MFLYKKIIDLLNKPEHAYAHLKGDKKHPNLYGIVKFYQTTLGVLILTEVYGLPKTPSFLGYHIHQGTSCTGNEEDPFGDALGHDNLNNTLHPYHSGDLPPLLVNHGYSFSIVFTHRFHVEDILDKVIIIHSQPDDFKTQPSGNAGNKIACGKIVEVKK